MRNPSGTTHRLALGGALLLCTLPAVAQQASVGGWLSQPTMTGDWGGTRTQLQDDGITLRAHWTTESAGNVSGGHYQTARYTQQLDAGADFDLDKLWGVPNAKIQFTVTDRRGRSLSNDALGNQFSVQELYGAGQNFRLAELNWQQDFLDHRIFLQWGWSPVGDDFARLPAFCNFQNGIICGHANAMTTNSGAHNFPTAQWGGHVKWHATPNFYATVGAYLDNPNAGNKDQGFNLSLKHRGVFVPVELGWTTGRGNGQLPGDLKLGAYYNTAGTPDVYTDVNGQPAGLTGADFLQHNGRSGGYVIADRMVYREGPDTNRGLTFGAMAGVGDEATARFRYFWVIGGHSGHLPRPRQRRDLVHGGLGANQSAADPLPARPRQRDTRRRADPDQRNRARSGLRREDRALAHAASQPAIHHPPQRHRHGPRRLRDRPVHADNVLNATPPLPKRQRTPRRPLFSPHGRRVYSE